MLNLTNIAPMLTKLFYLSLLALIPIHTVWAVDTQEETAGTAKDALDKLQVNQAQLDSKQTELKGIDSKINDLSKKEQSASNEAELAAEQLAYVSKKLDTAQLQYDQTVLSATVVKEEAVDSEEEIANIRLDIDETREHLKEVLRSLYQKEQSSFLDVLLGSVNLGTLMSERSAYRTLQERALEYVDELKEREDNVAEQLVELAQQQEQLQQLKELQGYQQADLSAQKKEKDDFVSLKQGEQSQYAREIAEAKQARKEIENQIFSLSSVGIELKLTDAFQAARFASSITGVRPALLLGIVKIETNVGKTLGTGKFPDDMHPASRDAFLRLTEQLQLDPYNTPLSRRPSNYKGWGGAIGPGQFLPDTWERIAARVSGLMQKPTPNPFELADALVGVGIMMADRGATDPSKEVEAVSRYLAGPNWQYHLWYSARVLAVAAEYEKEGLK
jgi:peptidoglycan hydrolase CwlO-like protein